MLVALYNAGDFISRYFTLLYLWDSRKGLFFACLSRALFIPCFYFAAKYATAGWMFLLCLSLGFSNGYLSTCIFMIAPRGYNVRKKKLPCHPLVCPIALFCEALGFRLPLSWLKHEFENIIVQVCQVFLRLKMTSCSMSGVGLLKNRVPSWSHVDGWAELALHRSVHPGSRVMNPMHGSTLFEI